MKEQKWDTPKLLNEVRGDWLGGECEAILFIVCAKPGRIIVFHGSPLLQQILDKHTLLDLEAIVTNALQSELSRQVHSGGGDSNGHGSATPAS